MKTNELQLAILHKVISELGDVGKTRLQKLGYFLQEALDISTKFPFRMHHYGPYSEALETDIARLKLAGYVKVEADQQGYGFHITKIDSPPEEWEQLIEPYRHSVERAISEFGMRSISELELAATIHFVNNLFLDIPSQEVVAKVKALKPNFDEDYVARVHAELKQNGWLG